MVIHVGARHCGPSSAFLGQSVKMSRKPKGIAHVTLVSVRAVRLGHVHGGNQYAESAYSARAWWCSTAHRGGPVEPAVSERGAHPLRGQGADHSGLKRQGRPLRSRWPADREAALNLEDLPFADAGLEDVAAGGAYVRARAAQAAWPSDRPPSLGGTRRCVSTRTPSAASRSTTRSRSRTF